MMIRSDVGATGTEQDIDGRLERMLEDDGITETAVLRAIRVTPRELFVRQELTEAAYNAAHLPIREGFTLPPTAAVARMVDALELQEDERVLHIGTGSGYTAALLGQLASKVYSVERLPVVAARARENLRELEAANVEVIVGNGFAGLPDHAPFDAILVTAAVSVVPTQLKQQLTTEGRLVIPLGPQHRQQTLMRYRKISADHITEEDLGKIQFAAMLGDLLVDRGAVTREQVEAALAEGAKARRKLGEELMEEHLVEESDIYRALALQRGLRFARAEELLKLLDLELVTKIPRRYLYHQHILPIHVENGVLSVATSDPDASLGEIGSAIVCEQIELLLITPTDYKRIWTTIDLLSGRGPQKKEKQVAESDDWTVDLMESVPTFDQRYVGLFDALLLDAIGEGASDIHLERYENDVRVRIRVDGQLRDLSHYSLTPRELIGIINVLKIRSGLDIAERRRPQGGRYAVRKGGQSFDLRVQTQPSLYGEHAVIRLLPQKTQLLRIEDLGFPADIANQYRRLLDNPSGLILEVGPTGSGKTTSLYAGLQVLARDETRKVITVEDPIEYSLPAIQQTQVNHGVDFVFANAMRAFVRQDPDVILVGEIRDHETALEAIRASQTGHVVLSTLHCNDSTDAVQRLIDLDMHPNSISSELLAIMAQRLARRICRGCKEPVEPDPTILKELFPDGAPDDFRCFAGRGCSTCQGYGTKGRVAVVEFLRANRELRSAISNRAPVDELREVALETGLVPMRNHALEHVQKGIIPLSELPRIISAERMALER